MTPEEKPESDPKPEREWKRSPEIAGLPPFHPFTTDGHLKAEKEPETESQRSPVIREPGT